MCETPVDSLCCWIHLPSSPQDLQRKHISKQYAMMWTMCAYLISSVPHVGMCANRWVWRGIQFLVLADQVIVHLYICCFEVVHIWLIRGRTRELHMGPSPKWPNVKTTFAAEKKKKSKTTQESISCQSQSFKYEHWRATSRLQVLNSQTLRAAFWRIGFHPLCEIKGKHKINRRNVTFLKFEVIIPDQFSPSWFSDKNNSDALATVWPLQDEKCERWTTATPKPTLRLQMTTRNIWTPAPRGALENMWWGGKGMRKLEKMSQ